MRVVIFLLDFFDRLVPSGRKLQVLTLVENCPTGDADKILYRLCIVHVVALFDQDVLNYTSLSSIRLRECKKFLLYISSCESADGWLPGVRVKTSESGILKRQPAGWRFPFPVPVSCVREIASPIRFLSALSASAPVSATLADEDMEASFSEWVSRFWHSDEVAPYRVDVDINSDAVIIVAVCHQRMLG